MGVRWKTTESPVFSYEIRLWITAFRSFPHRFSKGCGKPVRICLQTFSAVGSPHSPAFCISCGKQKILYNSSARRDSGRKGKNGGVDKQGKPTGFRADFQTISVVRRAISITCSRVGFGEDFLCGYGSGGMIWQIAQENALFHNFAPPTATASSKFFKLYYISLY